MTPAKSLLTNVKSGIEATALGRTTADGMAFYEVRGNHSRAEV